MRIPLIIAAAAITMTAATAQAQDTTVRWNDEKQTIEGFGGSSAWFADNWLAFPEPRRSEFVETLFSPTKGIGCSILRIKIEARGFPEQTRSWDWERKEVAAQIELISRAREHGVQTVLASPWTPPSWMKTNGKRKKGALKKEYYGIYAQALSQFVSGMKSEHGVAIDVLSLQNEPDEEKPWESCKWSEDEYIDFLKNHLGPRLESDRVDVRVMVTEHTMWNKHFKNVVSKILTDPEASRHVDVVAGHRYRGPRARAFPAVKDADKPLWMSEYYYEGGGNLTVNNARIVHNFMVKAEANAYLFWWLMSTPAKTRQSLIQLDGENHTYTVSNKAYAFGNFARFVRPGYRRIGMSRHKLDGGVLASAYKDPETGNFALVAINPTDQARQMTVAFEGCKAEAVVPHRTSNTENLAPLQPIALDDQKTLKTELPPQSVTTYAGNAAPTP